MKNRILALILVVALAAVGVAGATMAYFTDTDSAVNVATVGNVSIEMHEYQRADGVPHDAGELGAGNGVPLGTLVPYVQGQPLYPAYPVDNTAYTAEMDAANLFFWGDYVYSGTAGNGLWNDNKLVGAMDKMIFVENTGASACYFRTWIACECPEGMEYSEGSDKEFMANVNSGYAWTEGTYITIDGTRYYVFCGTYQNALQPGQQAHPSLLQVVMTHNVTSEQAALLGGSYEILAFTQAVQVNNFPNAETALAVAFGTDHPWTDGVRMPILVNTKAELQEALDKAIDGDTIILNDNITGDVVVPQKSGVKITLDGNGKTYAGTIVVDGKSATHTTAGLTIKDLTFKADSITKDACINLGDGTDATRYTCNVTVDGCTFDVPDAVGVKSYTGGDKNLTITNCTATAVAHSLAQLKGIDGVLVEGCTVNSIRGINFNNSNNITVSDTTIDVQKYGVRFGESANAVVENYKLVNCTITSDNVDDDAAIVLRAGATNANLTLENVTINATTEMSGHENANVTIK